MLVRPAAHGGVSRALKPTKSASAILRNATSLAEKVRMPRDSVGVEARIVDAEAAGPESDSRFLLAMRHARYNAKRQHDTPYDAAIASMTRACPTLTNNPALPDKATARRVA